MSLNARPLEDHTIVPTAFRYFTVNWTAPDDSPEGFSEHVKELPDRNAAFTFAENLPADVCSIEVRHVEEIGTFKGSSLSSFSALESWQVTGITGGENAVS